MYYLKHYFDPDGDRTVGKVKIGKNGRVDHMNRDIVHNVVAGEVLAEWIDVPDDEQGRHDPRFLAQTKSFPIGPNCLVDPQNPDRILAAVNGYVYYDDLGKIAVKTLLDIPHDIDYTTGNISFVGDVIVHGGIRSGFSVKGRNILIKGAVEGASMEASGSIQIEGGVKGDHRAEIRANGSVKLKFCENALISAGKNVLVDGSALHCKIFAGNSLAVRERLIGGEAICQKMVHVEEQLGGGLNTITQIVLGYDPLFLQKISALETKILELQRDMDRQTLSVARKDSGAVEKADGLQRKIALLKNQMTTLTEKLKQGDISNCAAIIPGEVRPGVEISIGPLEHSISDTLHDVRFTSGNNQIVVRSPAKIGRKS